MELTRFVYLAAIALSATGVAMAARRLHLDMAGHRLLRAMAVTVPIFLALDAAGAARGWFRSNPALNLAIVPPGISLEEPLLLAFLVLLSVVLWRAAGRWA
jgi:hypothetical protein